MWRNPQETTDLVTFTEEIPTGKLHFLCSVCVGGLTNFHKSFFVKKYYLNLNFFQVLSLKTKKKSLLKKDVSQLKIAWYSKRQRKSIEKRERKTKNENKSNNNNKYFLTLTFLYRKSYIFLENIFGKT